MHYKKIADRIKMLVIQPGKEWVKISIEPRTGKEVINEFTIPLIGLLTLAAFIGGWINSDSGLEHGLKTVIQEVTCAFGGLYMAGYFIHKILPQFGSDADYDSVMKMCGYSISIYYLTQAISSLMPELFIVKAAILYMAYIIWEAVPVLLKIDEDNRIGFSFMAFLGLVLSPFLIQVLLKTIFFKN